MAEDKNNFINEAGKNGLVLASVAIVYFLVTNLLAKIENGGTMLTVLSFVLWAAKLTLCIWLMFAILRKAAAENGNDRSANFRFGMAVAACSALVYAGFYLLYVSVIDTDFFKEAFDTIASAYSGMMNSDELDRVMNMESSMPAVTFFFNLIWCWLFGTIISAIASSRICGPDDPFANEN